MQNISQNEIRIVTRYNPTYDYITYAIFYSCFSDFCESPVRNTDIPQNPVFEGFPELFDGRVRF